jgi:hypothetical protein
MAVYFDQLNEQHYHSLSELRESKQTEDFILTAALLDLYRSGVKVPPVILDEAYNVIDGYHRLCAMFELGYEHLVAFVLMTD